MYMSICLTLVINCIVHLALSLLCLALSLFIVLHFPLYFLAAEAFHSLQWLFSSRIRSGAPASVALSCLCSQSVWGDVTGFVDPHPGDLWISHTSQQLLPSYSVLISHALILYSVTFDNASAYIFKSKTNNSNSFLSNVEPAGRFYEQRES